MDIIAEILNAEKAAEEKLREAEERSAQLLKKCEEESSGLKEKSEENIKEYERLKNSEADKKIGAIESEIKAQEQIKINNLDNIYNENHEKWEKDIENRILAL